MWLMGFTFMNHYLSHVNFLNTSTTFWLLRCKPTVYDDGLKCASVKFSTSLMKCFPNFSLVALHLPEPFTPHKAVGVRPGTSVATQHRSLSRTGWLMSSIYTCWVILYSLKEILMFMYFYFVFQNNGSLAWCQNHKQCSKVCPSHPPTPPYLSYLIAFNPML